jgi:chaperonin GroES
MPSNISLLIWQNLEKFLCVFSQLGPPFWVTLIMSQRITFYTPISSWPVTYIVSQRVNPQTPKNLIDFGAIDPILAFSVLITGLVPPRSARRIYLILKEKIGMNFRPLHDRVLIKRIEEEVTSGGIVIPDNAKEKPSRGKVIAVGKGKLLENGQIRPMDIQVGDEILFGKYAGTEVKIKGEELVVMREEDVMGVIEGK